MPATSQSQSTQLHTSIIIQNSLFVSKAASTQPQDSPDKTLSAASSMQPFTTIYVLLVPLNISSRVNTQILLVCCLRPCSSSTKPDLPGLGDDLVCPVMWSKRLLFHAEQSLGMCCILVHNYGVEHLLDYFMAPSCYANTV